MIEPEPLWCMCGHANYQHPISNYPVGPNKLPEERSDCEECDCPEWNRDYDLSHMDEQIPPEQHPEEISFQGTDIRGDRPATAWELILAEGPRLTPEGNKKPMESMEEFIMKARQFGKPMMEDEHVGPHVHAAPKKTDMELFNEHIHKRGYKPEVPALPNRASRRKTARAIKRQMKKKG